MKASNHSTIGRVLAERDGLDITKGEVYALFIDCEGETVFRDDEGDERRLVDHRITMTILEYEAPEDEELIEAGTRVEIDLGPFGAVLSGLGQAMGSNCDIRKGTVVKACITAHVEPTDGAPEGESVLVAFDHGLLTYIPFDLLNEL